MRAALALLLVAGTLAAGCGEDIQQLRIGTKDFAEQEILGEMLASLIRTRSGARALIQPCGDTYGCHQALQGGQIDLLVEYTGSGLTFIGGTPGGGDALQQVRERYAPLGIRWVTPLGFDNGYRLLVTPARASRLELRSISDLTRLEGGLRVACPPEYLRRPLDGLASLAKRYGLRLAAEPLVIADLSRRFQALLDGRADVAVGYGTDGAIAGLELVELADDLKFYPPYQAVVIARDQALRAQGQLAGTLALLEGQINTETMRQLNYRRQVEGWPARQVALQFLRGRKLIKGTASAPGRRTSLTLVAPEQDELGSLVPQAIRTVRTVFAGRAVAFKPAADPARQVALGRARLALLGAERFFRQRRGLALTNGAEALPQRVSGLEAAAVIGTRMMHLIRRTAEPPETAPLAGRIGGSPDGSGSAIVTESLLALRGSKLTRRAPLEALLRALEERALDAVLVLTQPGDAELAAALGKRSLRLLALPPAASAAGGSLLSAQEQMHLPYLRGARIPAQTYPGQALPLETLGSQVVLAGPRRQRAAVAAGGGPAAAFLAAAIPLSRQEVEALAEASKVPEAPDPILPTAWSVQQLAQETRQVGNSPAVDTVFNILAIGFLGWLGFIVRTRQRQRG